LDPRAAQAITLARLEVDVLAGELLQALADVRLQRDRNDARVEVELSREERPEPRRRGLPLIAGR
jgi:hypothetical protein